MIFLLANCKIEKIQIKKNWKMDDQSFGLKEIETNLFQTVFRQEHKGDHNRARMTGKFDQKKRLESINAKNGKFSV